MHANLIKHTSITNFEEVIRLRIGHSLLFIILIRYAISHLDHMELEK